MESWDVVIIGGGIAALRSAIAAADANASVVIIDASAVSASSGASPTTGIATSMGEVDTRAHIFDTTNASEELSNESIVQSRCSSAFDHLVELERWGLLYRRNSNGAPHLSTAPGHTESRLSGCGDVTERQIIRLLEEQCMKRNIPRKSDILAVRLVIENDQIRGLVVLDVQTGAVAPIQAKSIILATDGHRGLWSGVSDGCGTGSVLALDVGISLTGMEFTTWHPLCVADIDIVLPLELLDAGACIRTATGEPVDLNGIGLTTLSRLLTEQNYILDARNVHRGIRPWFQQVADRLLSRADLDIWSSVIPLQSRPMFTLGGAPIDGHGRVLFGSRDVWMTGLYAAGASSSSGLHGAESLAGNILLDHLAGGSCAGNHAGKWVSSNRLGGELLLESCADDMADRLDQMLNDDTDGVTVGAIESSLCRTMEQHAGLSRNGDGLKSALNNITELAERPARLTDSSPVMNTEMVRSIQLEGMLMLARATLGAAIARRESRGAHRRSDHPDKGEDAHHYLIDAAGSIIEMPC